jgi:hemolysin III
MALHLRGHDRWKLGPMLNPVRGLIDASAAGIALLAMVVLWLAGAGDLSRRVSLAVYGLTMVSLYTVSCLYHSVPWRETWKHRMQRLDHSMIYVLIAGTYTPIAAIVLGGWLRPATLGVIWGITIVGVGQKLLLPRIPAAFAVALTTTQGWLAVLLLVPLAHLLPWPALAWTITGGVLYTVGMIFLVTGRPRLWPRVFSHHEAMHVLVVSATACHFFMTLRYIAPYSG